MKSLQAIYLLGAGRGETKLVKARRLVSCGKLEDKIYRGCRVPCLTWPRGNPCAELTTPFRISSTIYTAEGERKNETEISEKLR